VTPPAPVTVLAIIVVRPGPFLAVIAAAAVAATAAATASGRGIVIPVVVLELVAGVVVGPHVIGLHADSFLTFFSDLGLALLFFFAGYEIDIGRILGTPLRRAMLGWLLSLTLAYALAGLLSLSGVVLSAFARHAAGTGPAAGWVRGGPDRPARARRA
jgi:Kef-type K+ transport system membrane component KefB